MYRLYIVLVFDIDDISTISNVFYVRMLLYICLYLILYILIPPLKHIIYPSSILECVFFSVAWRSRQVNLVAPRFPMQRWIVVSETWWASSFKIHLQTCPQTQITTYQTKSFHIWVLEYMGWRLCCVLLGGHVEVYTDFFIDHSPPVGHPKWGFSWIREASPQPS